MSLTSKCFLHVGGPLLGARRGAGPPPPGVAMAGPCSNRPQRIYDLWALPVASVAKRFKFCAAWLADGTGGAEFCLCVLSLCFSSSCICVRPWAAPRAASLRCAHARRCRRRRRRRRHLTFVWAWAGGIARASREPRAASRVFGPRIQRPSFLPARLSAGGRRRRPLDRARCPARRDET